MIIYCEPGNDGDACRRCGAEVLSRTQVCHGRRGGVDLDERVALDEPFSRRDWRVVLRAVERECHYLVRRLRRPSSEPDGGADGHALTRLRRLLPPLARAAADDSRFV